MRVLTAIAAHSGRGRRDDNLAAAARFHDRAYALGQAEQSESREAPAHFEGFIAGILKWSVANLRAKIIDHDFDGADILFDVGNAVFDRIIIHGIEQKPCSCAASGFDAIDQSIGANLGTATAEHGVIALACEFRSNGTANPGSCADHKTYRFHLSASISSLLELWSMNAMFVNLLSRVGQGKFSHCLIHWALCRATKASTKLIWLRKW